jgi:hypothetical protein
MSELPLDAAGRRRSPATLRQFHAGYFLAAGPRPWKQPTASRAATPGGVKSRFVV